ncbi:FG-GAP repeat domain-containing protein [Streptomyces sp. WAC04657]|uniref:FG-GAP repeat domain-containing protein n=1 Tax=Streptomyces sp. WAC04657 TaxID=1779145 RepID=UPI003B63403C
MLAINPAANRLYLYPGNGTGGFSARTDLGGGWGAMHLIPGELNNDGKSDFLAVDTTNHKLRLLPGKRYRRLRYPPFSPTTGPPTLPPPSAATAFLPTKASSPQTTQADCANGTATAKAN